MPDRPEWLVERARQGDRAAFDELVRRCEPRIVSLVRSRLGARLAGEVTLDDVVQETILKAFLAIGGFQWKGDDAFMRWLGTIAENVIRGLARRRKVTPASPLVEEQRADANSPSHGLRQEERLLRLEDALERLDPDCRRVIRLARLEGLPIREVARAMGRTPNATSILLYRALKKLKAQFGDTESLSLPPRGLEKQDEDSDDAR